MGKRGASNGSWQNVSTCTSFICFIGGVEISVRQWTRIKHFGGIFTVLCKTTN